MGLKLLSKKDQDWFVFEAEDGQCELLIRRIPLAKANEVEYRKTGRKQSLNVRRHSMEWDKHLSAEAHRELAAWAWLDARGGLEIDITTEDLAKAIGNGTAMGDTVVLDGKLTDSIRVLVLDEVPALPRWILEHSAKLHKKAKEEEEGED